MKCEEFLDDCNFSLQQIFANYGSDPELLHEKLDELLCEILIEEGFKDIVLKYSEIKKQYC